VRPVRAHRLLRFVPVPARQQARGQRGHALIRSFEPGEDWFWDYVSQKFYEGPELAAPQHHPASQPVPGPHGKVPADWQDHLH
jgi:hypothetical protein